MNVSTGDIPTVASDKRVERVTLALDGLSCGDALKLEHVLARTPGVNRVYVNSFTEMAYIDFDPGVCGADTLVSAIVSAGYHANERDLRPHG